MRRLGSASIALAGLLVFGPAPSTPAEPDAGPPSTTTDLVRDEFLSVCRRFTEGDGQFFGRTRVDDLEARLALVDGDPLGELLLRGRLGYELIRLGRHTEAIAHLERTLEIIEGDAMEGREKLRSELHRLLALAHLQIAEDENCLAHHSAASCILPFAAGALHVEPVHTRAAADHLAIRLEATPGDVGARWLLNLAHMLLDDYPEGVPARWRLPDDALASEAPFPAWHDVAAAVGVSGFDLSGGAVMDDFDGDGLLDLVSSSWDPCEPLKAYRNRGDGSFENVSSAWGLDGQLGGLNLRHGDYDGDGRLDLLVLRGAWLGQAGRIRNSLLRNELVEGRVRFTDVTAAAGLAYPAYPTQTADWGDYDSDGDLDLYVGNEASGSNPDPLALSGDGAGTPFPSQLFRNDGGRFTDVARAAGVTNGRFAKGVAWADYDDDGDLDLYVSNLGVNRLYRNRGDGTFEDVAPSLGLTRPDRGSFSTWWFDFDNDGDLDLFVAGYQAPVHEVLGSYLGMASTSDHPVLYRNRGDGTFEDDSLELGLDRPLLVMGANYGDLDNDGFPDLYLGTGVPAYEALMPNVLYRNDGGRRLLDVTSAAGLGHLQKGHGVAFGDIDQDGRQEIFEQLGGAFPYDAYGNALFEGPPNDARWLVLRLRGDRRNPFAVGARVAVTVRTPDGSRTVHGLVGAGGSFGGSSLQHELGLGDALAIERLVIRWPGGGAAQEYPGVPLDGYYSAVQGAPTLERLPIRSFDLGTLLAFESVTQPRTSSHPQHHQPAEDPQR